MLELAEVLLVYLQLRKVFSPPASSFLASFFILMEFLSCFSGKEKIICFSDFSGFVLLAAEAVMSASSGAIARNCPANKWQLFHSQSQHACRDRRALGYWCKTLEDGTQVDGDKENVAFSRLALCVSPLQGNGAGCLLPAGCPCAA